MGIEHLWNMVFDIQTPTVTQGTYGEVSKGWVTTHEDVQGRLQRKVQTGQGTENATVGRDAVWSDYNLYCDSNTVISAQDRVVYGARTFEVISVDNANQMSVFKKVELLEIR